MNKFNINSNKIVKEAGKMGLHPVVIMGCLEEKMPDGRLKTTWMLLGSENVFANEDFKAQIIRMSKQLLNKLEN